MALVLRTLVAAAALAGAAAASRGGMETMAAWEEQNCALMTAGPQDCRYEGAFACAGLQHAGHPPNAVVGQGVFGYCHKTSAAAAASATPPAGPIQGALDSVTPELDGTVGVQGWAVDHAGPGGGRTPIAVGVAVDGKIVYSALANTNRPGLVKAGVAPDPDHGFVATISAGVAAAAGIGWGSHGNRTVTLHAWRWNDTSKQRGPTPFGQAKCIADGRALEACGGAPVPIPEWSCCRFRPNAGPLTPAPPRVPKKYPLPPSSRPAPGKASVVLFITDDQDKKLDSLRVCPITRPPPHWPCVVASAAPPRTRCNLHAHVARRGGCGTY